MNAKMSKTSSHNLLSCMSNSTADSEKETAHFSSPQRESCRPNGNTQFYLTHTLMMTRVGNRYCNNVCEGYCIMG